MTVSTFLRRMICVAALPLAACGDAQQSTAPAATPVPAEPSVMRIYERSCRACHGVRGTGAPVTGDRLAWVSRVQQGMDTMLERTIKGYRGMPPLGSCGDCSEDEFVALIRFMAQMDAGAQ